MFAMQVVPAVPVKPLEWFTPDPERRQIRFEAPGGEIEADLYVPGGDGPFAATLLFLGVNPAGRDDARVVNLAGGLARTGRVVMVPWSESMVAKRIDVAEAGNLVGAFQYLSALEFVDPGQVGMAGFCVGASMAAVAAQDPLIADRVAYVNFFGGYLDAADLVVSVASATRSYRGQVEPWEPAALSVEVVRIHLIEDIADPAERDVLERAFLRGEAVDARRARRPLRRGRRRVRDAQPPIASRGAGAAVRPARRDAPLPAGHLARNRPGPARGEAADHARPRGRPGALPRVAEAP